VYEVTPLTRHVRRRSRANIGSSLGFGRSFLASSIGLMAMLVALGVMSITWMAVIAVLATAQKLLPARAALNVPLALVIVGTGNLDRPRALVGSRARATDVRRHRWHGPGQAVVTTRRRKQ